MEFDINKVYTAVNADILKIGSKCIFADTVKDLRFKVSECEENIKTLDNIYDDNDPERFVSGNCTYLLAYFIEPPKDSQEQKEPEYKPFSNVK